MRLTRDWLMLNDVQINVLVASAVGWLGLHQHAPDSTPMASALPLTDFVNPDYLPQTPGGTESTEILKH